MATQSMKPWHRTDDPLSSRKAPSRKLVWFSLTPKEKTSTYFYFQNTKDQEANLPHMLCLQSVSVCWEGWEQREGQPVLCLRTPLPFCLSPCRIPEGQTGFS